MPLTSLEKAELLGLVNSRVRRAATGTGLTEEQEEVLESALVYDDVAWDIGTTYAPNTIVKKTGSDTLYLQAADSDSTGDDPASGAPWEVWSAAGGTMTGAEIKTALGPDGITNTEVASVSNTLKGDIGAGLADLTPAEVRDLLVVIPPTRLGFIATRYYAFETPLASVTTLALASGRLYLRQFVAPVTFTPTSLNLFVTAGVALTDVEILVYSAHATTVGPDVRLYASGALAAATSSTNATASSSMPTFTRGTRYWIGVTAFGTSTVRAAGGLPAYNGGVSGSGASAVDNIVTRTGISIGAAPNPFVFAAADLGAVTMPLITFVAP